MTSSTRRRRRSRRRAADARHDHVGAGDVRVENVPDPSIVAPTDAIIRVVRACICGSDLWPYNDMPSETGQRVGREAIGVVTDTGSEVRTVKPGQVVVMPFTSSDGTCQFCHQGLNTACVHVGFFGNNGMNGAQAEALRIPLADGTLYRSTSSRHASAAPDSSSRSAQRIEQPKRLSNWVAGPARATV